MSSKRVLFIGLGKVVSPFIEQRIALLSQLGLKVSVLYNKDISNADSKNVVYISKKPLKLFQNIHKWFFRFHVLLPWLWLWKKKHGFGLKQWINELMGIIAILQARDVAVIHAQWFLKASMLEFLDKAFPSTPLIISARGSQVTIYPITKHGWTEVLLANFSKASMIHCVSEDIKKHCVNYGAIENKLYVNYNGIRTDFFKPKLKFNTINKDCLRLITVGSLTWVKGYIYQLQLLNTLMERGMKVNLTFVGDGPDLNALKFVAFKMGLEKHINWLGKLPLSRVLVELQKADIYVSTSIAEGLPNSVAEAAACGLPIIAFECEGLKELLPLEQHQYIVPFADISALASACERLLDPENRVYLSKTLSNHIQSHFNAEDHASRMIERYRQIQHA